MLFIDGMDRYDFTNNPMSDVSSFTLWFAGCTHRCYNCQNPRLWDKYVGTEYSANTTFNLINLHIMRYGKCDVVLLGGEPRQQDSNELILLCKRLHDEMGINIWLYTGYNIVEILNGETPVDKSILDYVYIIKCGRYIDDQKGIGRLASSNQHFYKRSEDGCWHIIHIE